MDSRLVRFFFVSLIIATVIVCVLTFAPIPKHWSFESEAELNKIRTELPLAEARWKSHNITDYEIDVSGLIHPIACENVVNHDLLPWHLTIRQGQIIFDNDEQEHNIAECGIRKFLPPQVFDTIKQIIEHAKPEQEYRKIEFDPEYGFVSEYYLTSNGRLSSLLVTFSFKKFQPKKP